VNVVLYEMQPDPVDAVCGEWIARHATSLVAAHAETSRSAISATIRRDIQQEAVPSAVTRERDSRTRLKLTSVAASQLRRRHGCHALAASQPATDRNMPAATRFTRRVPVWLALRIRCPSVPAK
jgi:hypothetical protein